MEKFNEITLASLPAELTKIIIKSIYDAEDFTQNLSALMLTSKYFYRTITGYLRDPKYLLHMLNILPHHQMNPFFNTFFTPESDNYAAIKLAAEGTHSNTIHHARICFALMRTDGNVSKQSSWAPLRESIDFLKKEKTLTRLEFLPEDVNLSRIEISLRLAYQLFSGIDIWNDVGGMSLVGKLNFEHLFSGNGLFRVYINLSGLDLRVILGPADDHSIPLCSIGLLRSNPAIFMWTNFRGSNLAGVPMDCARCNGTNFVETDLTNASFSETEIKGANFRMAILKNITAKFEGLSVRSGFDSSGEEEKEDFAVYIHKWKPVRGNKRFTYSDDEPDFDSSGEEEIEVDSSKKEEKKDLVINLYVYRQRQSRFFYDSEFDDFNNSSKKEEKKDIAVTDWHLEAIVDLKKLTKSPKSLSQRLAYLSTIEFDDDLKKILRQKVLSHLLSLKNSAENIALLEAAKASSFFGSHPNGFVDTKSGVVGAFFPAIETDDQKALGLRIEEFKRVAQVGNFNAQ